MPELARNRFDQAITRFDEENAKDPNIEIADGQPRPRELLYAIRLTNWVERLTPNASEELLLAARCQHLCRWMIPRTQYEMTKPGYLKWRNDLKKFHAAKSGEILTAVGYPDETIQKVQALNLKKNFPGDPESRILEDALCLVFLQYQLTDLAARTEEDKVVNALQKSWNKMSEPGRAAALALDHTPVEKALLQKALQPKGA
ncbi:MAG: hypothetical protein JWM16_1778 [Verrucomicrobiales bacterium]|nr:hypothetical protein [Verrucomicrobiales bacterium]